MGKRLTRYWGNDLTAKLPSLEGKTFDLVLQNSRTLHVKLISFDGQKLAVENFRQKKVEIALGDVDELIYMEEAAF